MTVRIVVTYLSGEYDQFEIGEQDWRVDAPLKCLVVGRGVPRVFVPLNAVGRIDVEEAGPEATT